MNDTLLIAELWCRRILGAAGCLTLVLALVRIVQYHKVGVGRSSGAASRLLRPSILLLATAAFLAVGILLWRRLPIFIGVGLRITLLIAGTVAMLAGVLLYLWGLKALGTMFDASSGFGARLRPSHRLVVHGPYAIVRNPMYLGVIVAFLGGLLVYQTWTMLIYTAMMFFLPIRATREERLLAEQFGVEWKEYAARVPGWIPWIGQINRRRAHNKSLELTAGRPTRSGRKEPN